MFTRALVGVDEHQGGRDAISLAGILCPQAGRLTLAHVYGGDAYNYRGASGAYLATEAQRAQALLETAREESGVEAQVRWRAAPSVGQGLHELCELIKADLLVVGSCRRGRLGRVLLGDDTRRSLDGACCPVAVSPTGYAAQPLAMREVGVAYDGSPESEYAVTVARTIAAEHQAKLSAFEVVELPNYVYMPDAAAAEDVFEALVQQARSRIESLGGVEPHAALGLPAEELSLYSASLDLLIVGSRGYGPCGRLLHGSLSHQLLSRARCPMLVLTRGGSQVADGERPSAARVTAAT